jgi:TetR/AcrR family transcriptional regulator
MDHLSRREKERQVREAEIINAAEKVFYEKGFDGASMDEVAKEAQFTKRTVYQYFTNKDELYFTIAVKGFKQLLSYFEAAIEKGQNGFEKINLSGLAYYQFYKDFPDAFRLLNHCRFTKIKTEESPVHQEMMALENMMFEMFTKAMESGKADGSIRADLDARKGAYFVVSISIGFLNMFSEAGMGFGQRYALDQEEFILFGLDLLCDAIRGKKREPGDQRLS